MSIAASSIPAQAFRFMELSPLSSFEDDTEEATAAAEQYPIALRMCLEAADWSFASKRGQLTQMAVAGPAPDPQLPYRYQLPSDFIAMREVELGKVRWRIDGPVLRADQTGPLFARYTAEITDEESLPGNFKTAVAARLAALLAAKFVTSRQKLVDMEDRAASYLREALGADAGQAMSVRYDGLCEQGDWVLGAIR